MNKQELLQQAIHSIAVRAGIEQPVFHLTSVSRDAAGVFIMQTAWPEGKRMCNRIACAVRGFPRDPFTSCIPLLPELVDEIIRAANDEMARVEDAGTRGHMKNDRCDQSAGDCDGPGALSHATRRLSA